MNKALAVDPEKYFDHFILLKIPGELNQNCFVGSSAWLGSARLNFLKMSFGKDEYRVTLTKGMEVRVEAAYNLRFLHDRVASYLINTQ